MGQRLHLGPSSQRSQAGSKRNKFAKRIPELMEHRKNGRTAYFVKDKVVVKPGRPPARLNKDSTSSSDEVTINIQGSSVPKWQYYIVMLCFSSIEYFLFLFSSYYFIDVPCLVSCKLLVLLVCIYSNMSLYYNLCADDRIEYFLFLLSSYYLTDAFCFMSCMLALVYIYSIIFLSYKSCADSWHWDNDWAIQFGFNRWYFHSNYWWW